VFYTLTLQIEDLYAEIGGKAVLRGVNIELKRGEVLALMGPNGSGKTTLANAVAGSPSVIVKRGKIVVDGEDITGLPPEERSLHGVLLLFQQPPEIPGVKLSTLMIAAYNKRRGSYADLLKATDPSLFSKMRSSLYAAGLNEDFLFRDLNVGFSGGERKRLELAQAMILGSKYLLMDEPDSGLDVEGLKAVGSFIEDARKEGRGVLLITHYTRLFSAVRPDRIAILFGGKVVVEGGLEVAERVEKEGYSWLEGQEAKRVEG